MTPRVSVLIPNFNNGRESSRSGQMDLLGNLLQSLWSTLAEDPTPLEIIAYDDGSTDDSLATLRHWASRTWRDGQPFLELIEAPHCGYLSRIANILCRKARGEFLVRLDGDIVCLTPHWAATLCDIFDRMPPRLGIIGPKQLGPTGKIHAMGDWILHPKGYHHVGQGLDRYALAHPVEVDHAMGCFHVMRRAVFDDIGGYDEEFLRGQTEDLGLRARLKGWSCIAVPNIEFVHYHFLRVNRDTEADSPEGIRRSLDIFRRKWGFSRLAPDLDEVRRRYVGTPLLWNARWFALDEPAEAPLPPAPKIEQTDWGRYTSDPAFRQSADLRIAAAIELIRGMKLPQATIVQVGSGAGLYIHLLTALGLTATGVDTRQGIINFARNCIATHRKAHGQADPAAGADRLPQFLWQSDPRRLPLDDHCVDLLLFYDLVERHPNPVGLFLEARRVLRKDRPLLIVSNRYPDREVALSDREHWYRSSEIITQINAVGGFDARLGGNQKDPTQPLIAVARRTT